MKPREALWSAAAVTPLSRHWKKRMRFFQSLETRNELQRTLRHKGTEEKDRNGRPIMKKMLFLILFVLIQNTAFSENFGLFKADWNTISVNQLVTSDRNTTIYVDGRASTTTEKKIFVRSISFKFINDEFEDWKAALKGEKIRYCAIRVDVDWEKSPSQDDGRIELVFYDQDGIKVSPDYSNATTLIAISRGNGEAKSVTFSPDRSRGAPVRFEIQ
jgi:hypothetical protein